MSGKESPRTSIVSRDGKPVAGNRRIVPTGEKRKAQSIAFEPQVLEILKMQAGLEGRSVSSFLNQLVRETVPDPRTGSTLDPKPCIIVGVNNKGGVGKTTSMSNLGSLAAMRGYKVLMIDLDPQGSLSKLYGFIDPEYEKPTIRDVLVGDGKGQRRTLDEVMIKDVRANMDLIPSDTRFSDAWMQQEVGGDVVRIERLKMAINALEENYDIIFIDCPPGIGVHNTVACVAIEAGNTRSMVVIPVKFDQFVAEGLTECLDSINETFRARGVAEYKTYILRDIVQSSKLLTDGTHLIRQKCPGAVVLDHFISAAIIHSYASMANVPTVEYTDRTHVRKKAFDKMFSEWNLLAEEVFYLATGQIRRAPIGALEGDGTNE